MANNRMLQDFEGDGIAMSYQGELAVLRNKKTVFFCTGKRQLNDNGWRAIFIQRAE